MQLHSYIPAVGYLLSGQLSENYCFISQNSPPPALAKHKADKKGNQVTDNVQRRHKTMGPYKMTETISSGINNGWHHLTEGIF